jgi:hypothetical protein
MSGYFSVLASSVLPKLYLEPCYFAKNQTFYRNNELIEPFVLVSDVNEMLYANVAIKSQRSPSRT